MFSTQMLERDFQIKGSLMNIFGSFTTTLCAVVSAGVLLTGCASTTKYQDYPDQAAMHETASTVHVVRESSVVGSALTAPVYVNKYLIGRIGPGGHLKVKVPTGRIHVTSTTADSVVDAEARGEYFFEVTMPLQGWLYAPDFIVTRIDRRRAMEVIGR